MAEHEAYVDLIKWGAYAITGILGWINATLWKKVSTLEEKLATEYVRKEDYKDTIKQLREDIFNKFASLEKLLISHLNNPNEK